jgi:hypothetical protein
MMLGLGTLLLASNSMDPRVGERPRLTATTGFLSFTVPEGFLQFEYPNTWKVEQGTRGAISYDLRPPSQTAQPISIDIFNSDLSPEQIANALQQQSGLPAMNLTQVQSSAFRGVSGQVSVNVQSQPYNVGYWIFTLDPNHKLLIQAVSLSRDWPGTEQVAQHLLNTLKIDVAAAAKMVDVMPTPIATSAPTAAATSAR